MMSRVIRPVNQGLFISMLRNSGRAMSTYASPYTINIPKEPITKFILDVSCMLQLEPWRTHPRQFSARTRQHEFNTHSDPLPVLAARCWVWQPARHHRWTHRTHNYVCRAAPAHRQCSERPESQRRAGEFPHVPFAPHFRRSYTRAVQCVRTQCIPRPVWNYDPLVLRR